MSMTIFSDEVITVELKEVVRIDQKDYDKLSNKPQINGVTLQGNKSALELGLVPSDLSQLEAVEQPTKSVRQTADMFVDNNGKPSKIALQQVKDMATKVVYANELGNVDFEKLDIDDYVILGDKIYRVIDAENNIKQLLPETSAEHVTFADKQGEYTSTNVEDALAEVMDIAKTGGVTGVKGDAETEYRKGNVSISKANIGLDQVDNTADVDKPISNAQAEKNEKLESEIRGVGTVITNHKNDKDNPHSVTKAQIGLGNVDNTADVDKIVKEAGKATNDGAGNNIVDTYASKQYVQEGLAGKSRSIAFANYQAFVTAINGYSNTTLKVSDNVFVKTLGVPDMWVTAVNSEKVAYTYTNDQAIVNALNTTNGLTVGYYAFSQLETTKVDLTNYQQKTDSGLSTTNKTVVGAINEVKGTADNALSKANTNATEISQIKDGTTKVKKAEHADTTDNATNVTTNINGKAISSIFETNGTTAKEATHAGKATSADKATQADSASKVANNLTFRGQNAQGTESTTGFDGSQAQEVAFNGDDFVATKGNAFEVSLAPSGVTAGTYNNVTVDEKGRVTAGSNKDYATTAQVNAKQNALTETQLAAVNSGITEAKRTKYDGYEEIINQKANSAELATVATSGSYNDLSDKPTIPTDYVKYTAQSLTAAQKSQARTNIGAGTSNFDGTWGSLSGKPNVVQSTGNSTSDVMSQKAVTDELNKKASTSEVNAKYTKPESGIPKSDLAEDVKTSLNKADTALQNVPSYNDLPNIPVQNQDLAVSGFTPVANTYYRHTGATTATFTQGVIYLYNGTGYAALDGSGSGGGKTYQLVKKTMRCTVTYDLKNDILEITLPTAANKNMLDVLKENNNCSLRLYRGENNMTAYYVDLQPHQREETTTANPTTHNYCFDFTGGLNVQPKKLNMFSASFVIKSEGPNTLIMLDATKSMAMANFSVAPPVVTYAFENYTQIKCTIADLIWWELEEVTE